MNEENTKQIEYNIIYRHDLREFPEQPTILVRVLRDDGFYEEIYNAKSIELREYKQEDKSEIIVEKWKVLNLEDELTEQFTFTYLGKVGIHATPEKTMVSRIDTNLWYNIPEYEKLLKEKRVIP